MTSVTQRLEALRKEERRSIGLQLKRVRRQIAMLTEADRKPMGLPEQQRRFS